MEDKMETPQLGRHYFYMSERECERMILACNNFLRKRGIKVDPLDKKDWGATGRITYKN